MNFGETGTEAWNMTRTLIIIIAILSLNFNSQVKACSVIYYLDSISGKIYVANNEDYWYDIKAYIQIYPRTKNKLARLWYGWDDFAQGGINEAGFFFDGAVTPEESIPSGYHKPKGNLGDDILATCKSVDQAIELLENKKVALSNAHIMFGDNLGNAAIIEWINGEKQIIHIKGNTLIMTNFLLSDTSKGNYPCYRYNSIAERTRQLRDQKEPVTLLQVGNLLGAAAQSPRSNSENRIGGTLYSSFINISDMEFFLVYKLDNTRLTELNLIQEFESNKKKRIKLENL